MGRARGVPWSSPEEWSWVYQNCFSLEKAKQWEAIHRIRAWTSRGRVPIAVESTAALIEIGYSVSHSNWEKRMLLSMALIRFVNGIVDAGQKGTFAAAAQTIADAVGLPLWFVELRHQGTHDKLPHLNVLESARRQALNWLRENYWVVQQNYEAELLAQLLKLIGKYKYSRKAFLSERVDQFDAKTDSCLNQIKELMASDNESIFLIKTLLEPGMLISKQRKSPFKTLVVWEPLLTMAECTYEGFIGDLVDYLLELSSDQPDPIKGSFFNVDEWIDCLVHKYMIPWQKYLPMSVLKPLLSCPSPERLGLIQKLVSTHPCPPKQLVALVGYLAVRYQSCPDQAQVNVDDLVDKMLILVDRIQHTTIPSTERVWCLAEHWKSTPLGLTDERCKPNLDLGPCFDDMDWLYQEGCLYIPNGEVLVPDHEVEQVALEIDPQPLAIKLF